VFLFSEDHLSVAGELRDGLIQPWALEVPRCILGGFVYLDTFIDQRIYIYTL
jgi:hypothetical protein